MLEYTRRIEWLSQKLRRLLTLISETGLKVTIINTTESEAGVRNVLSNYRTPTGLVRTTSSGAVQFESSLEEDFAELLDFNRDVATITAQPLTIRFSVDSGEPTKYTPDFLCTFRPEEDYPVEPSTLYEVKYHGELKDRWAKLKPGFRAATRLCKERGWHFRLITEKQIRTPYLDNVKILRRFRNLEDSDEYGISLLTQLEKLGHSTPNQLLAITFASKTRRLYAMPLLWRLIAIGFVGCDLSSNLNMNSEIWDREL